jgi:hypothetical protein
MYFIKLFWDLFLRFCVSDVIWDYHYRSNMSSLCLLLEITVHRLIHNAITKHLDGVK